MGLAGSDWIGTMGANVTEKMVYQDFLESADELGEILRPQCDMIIAISHMRIPFDRELAKEAKHIDLVLGGHDHLYAAEMDEDSGVFLVKSGSDFEDFSNITLDFCLSREEARQKIEAIEQFGSELTKAFYSERSNILMTVERVRITSKFERDPEVLTNIKAFADSFNVRMGKVVGYAGVPLDGVFETRRLRKQILATGWRIFAAQSLMTATYR
jgi:5'-nucleotidase